MLKILKLKELWVLIPLVVSGSSFFSHAKNFPRKGSFLLLAVAPGAFDLIETIAILLLLYQQNFSSDLDWPGVVSTIK